MTKRPVPSGPIVSDWSEFGHHFQIEQLTPPLMVGAGLRRYRLWHNSYPATGGQYHYDAEGARSRAQYLLQADYSSRIRFLESEVNTLRKRLAEAGITG